MSRFLQGDWFGFQMWGPSGYFTRSPGRQRRQAALPARLQPSSVMILPGAGVSSAARHEPSCTQMTRIQRRVSTSHDEYVNYGGDLSLSEAVTHHRSVQTVLLRVKTPLQRRQTSAQRVFALRPPFPMATANEAPPTRKWKCHDAAKRINTVTVLCAAMYENPPKNKSSLLHIYLHHKSAFFESMSCRHLFNFSHRHPKIFLWFRMQASGRI